jgi:hypothetical protein
MHLQWAGRAARKSCTQAASGPRPLRSLRLAPPPKTLGEVELHRHRRSTWAWSRDAPAVRAPAPRGTLTPRPPLPYCHLPCAHPVPGEYGRGGELCVPVRSACAPGLRPRQPLPRSWGRGRPLLRGTSKKAVGGEGPRRAATGFRLRYYSTRSSSAPPHLRTSALPYFRTSALPYFRTSVLPYSRTLRTSVPPYPSYVRTPVSPPRPPAPARARACRRPGRRTRPASRGAGARRSGCPGRGRSPRRCARGARG